MAWSSWPVTPHAIKPTAPSATGRLTLQQLLCFGQASRWQLVLQYLTCLHRAHVETAAALPQDELINYVGFARHEVRALAELVLRSGRAFEVLGSNAALVKTNDEVLRRDALHFNAERLGQQVAVRLM